MAQASQQVIWTCLPNGLTDDGDLKVSVMISPRLKLFGGAPELAQFKDWLDWPAKLAEGEWAFEIGGQKRPGKLVSTPDSAVWKALFTPETHVKSRVFEDFSNRTILSYPIAATAAVVERVYQDLAVGAEDDLPSAGSFGPLARGLQKPKEPASVLRELAKEGVGGFSKSLPDILDLLGAYHRPLERAELHHYENQGPDDPQPSSKWRSQRLAPLPAAEDFQKLIDFHQVVSALGQHPMLLRPCGLVLDFEVSRRGAPASGEIRFVPKWKPDPTIDSLPDETPATAFEIEDKAFTARPRNAAESHIAGSWLRLNPKAFDVVQMDVDGAGLKLRNFALSVWRTQDESTADESFGKEEMQPHRTGAPTLRSGGLTLAQRQRDQAVKAMFKGATKLQTQHVAEERITLFAEDLVRGYRADVWDDRSEAWRSLCRRDGTYTLVNDGSVLRTEDEEGVIRLAATESTDGENPDVMKIHEGLFVWRGWSLCASLPMPAIGINDEVAEPDNAAPEGLPLETDFTVRRGSLPSLRFGRTYQLRVRLVDLAGNSLPFDPELKVPPEVLSEQEAYLRYEPVEAPALALVDAPDEWPTDGESMGRLAIRTFNDPYDAVVSAEPPMVRRHVLAPRVTHNFAELNGALDTSEGRVDPDLFALLAARDVGLSSTVLETPAWRPAGAPPVPPIKTSYAVAPEAYTLTYLPDPLAHGVAIRIFGLDHVDPDEVFRIDLYPDDARWPDAAPFQIGLTDGQRQPKFVKDKRLFSVAVGRAERARLRISCLIGDRDLDLLAVWRLIEAKGLPATQLERLRKRAVRGQHWMMTPWREIDLVHAVQKPLIMTVMEGLGGNGLPNASRSLGRTPAHISFSTPLHAKSTARLDLFGRWQEPRDTLAGGPDSRESEAQAQSWTVSRRGAPDDRWSERSALHDFPDTRYRRVLYRLEATSRFREYMPPEIRNSPGGEPVKVVSDEVRVWIPNAAPPPPPQVRYVIPTFGWSRGSVDGKKTSWRRGGGLRVYMDRPWFASGHGELLGVLLPRPDTPLSTIEGPLKAHVTQWGADPIWLGGRVEQAAPGPGAFPLRVTGGPAAVPGAPDVFQDEGADLPDSFDLQGLSVPGLDSSLRVDVAAHQVGFDASRGLWYCDVVVRPGDAYFPFIRLALARYHPVSVSGAHLSQVVLAEFQQLTPDRYVSVSRSGDHVTVAVHGYTGGKTLGFLESGRIEVELQQLAAGADETLDWKAVPPPATPQAGPRGDLGVGQIRVRNISAVRSVQPRNAAERALSAEAIRLSEANDFEALAVRPDLLQWLLPPLIWEGEIRTPPAQVGRRLRILITERERHPTGDRDAAGVIPTADRIVYAEAVAV
ncbi:MAG: hypothetical protein EPO51_06285 [Phenylobacterium sp.]|uniref:hypothetical protein n=1 Tax=Phenylobacterium sp. TaxID=1871053 RepID=UPI001204E9CC|nr:hypothetical protein [Phenylobacterium sp.]TAJ73240.1 MAG: hypothetical protein EPO51_06285 [Phenylobacterium sp.]